MKTTHINIDPQENIWERALLRYVSKRNQDLKTGYENMWHTIMGGGKDW